MSPRVYKRTSDNGIYVRMFAYDTLFDDTTNSPGINHPATAWMDYVLSLLHT